MNSQAPDYPALYEINTRTWLDRRSRQAGRPVTLADIDEATLDRFAACGFQWIWLLGVWRTGIASRAISRTNAAWRKDFTEALPDLTMDDIAGSSFAISAYEVEPALGGPGALHQFRTRLARRGIRLMLDFVPNHTALDHPWVAAHPDFYVAGNEAARAAAPTNYLRVQTRVLAHGRDPNLPGWPDTLQLDYGNAQLQAAQQTELLAIAELCDGVRCDMAMLVLPDIFKRTWGIDIAPFWPATIETVRRAHPGFVLLAEAYWDLEWELQQQGFDFCYDKRLYDRLRDGNAQAIRAHLGADIAYQSRLARFLENHDEPRAASIFALPQHQAAAIVTYLSPGLRFFHQGQFEGARVHVPVHLRRAPVEPTQPGVAAFYERLLSVLATDDAFRHGVWSPLSPQPAWPGNPTSNDVISCIWRGPDDGRTVIAVNYSDHQAQCRLPLPLDDVAGGPVRLADVMGNEEYIRDRRELVSPGLFLDLRPWHFNVFRLDPGKHSTSAPSR
jgi:hypothetical protein